MSRTPADHCEDPACPLDALLIDLGSLENVEMGEPEVEEAENHSVSAAEDTTADEEQDGPDQDMNGEQGATPRAIGRSRKGEPRSAEPCPVQGCKGDGSERHQVCHERQCRVAGCKCGNTTFPNVRALG